MRAQQTVMIGMGRQFLKGDLRWGKTEGEFVGNLSMVYEVDRDYVRQALREAEYLEYCLDHEMSEEMA